MKYIIATQEKEHGKHEVFVCTFSDNIVHSIMFSQLQSVIYHQNNTEKRPANFTHPPVIARSAGFIDKHGRYFGESTSLGLKAGNKDKQLVEELDLTRGSLHWKINSLDVSTLWDKAPKSQDEQSLDDINKGLRGDISEEETPA